MKTYEKVDNKRTGIKLDLRRYMLKKHHVDEGKPIRVFDCCQAQGVMWKVLRSEFDIESYWGVDVKDRKGLVTGDSIEVLKSGLSHENVIDIDTYGFPWEHYKALMGNLKRSVTIFLTCGRINSSNMARPKVVLEALGIESLNAPVPLPGRASLDIGVKYCLHHYLPAGFEISDWVQPIGQQDWRELHGKVSSYYGVRIEKKPD